VNPPDWVKIRESLNDRYRELEASPKSLFLRTYVLLGITSVELVYLLSKVAALPNWIAERRRVGRTRRIAKPPGSTLARWAEAVYSKKTYHEVFLPILSDLEKEYQEALAGERWRKARWIAIRGRGSFWGAVVARVPVSFTRLVVNLWKLSGL
jgi:hypothetical protein